QARAPNSPDTWTAIARFAQIMGRTDEAQAAWRRVVELAPTSIDAISVLLSQFPEAVDETLLARAGALAEDTRTDTRNRRRLHFALYAYNKSIGRLDPAFDHLAAGNRVRRDELVARQRGYSHGGREKYFARIMATFDREFFERTSGFGDPTAEPIFIVGMPRSGTTLCEQILASYSLVYGAGELEGIRDAARLLPRALV